MVDTPSTPNPPDTTATMQIDPVQAKLLEPTWVNRWREIVAFAFVIITIYDFVLAPIITQVLVAVFKANLTAWTPNTLQSGGMFYVAFATILGISSYGKFTEARELIRNMPDHSDRENR